MVEKVPVACEILKENGIQKFFNDLEKNYNLKVSITGDAFIIGSFKTDDFIAKLDFLNEDFEPVYPVGKRNAGIKITILNKNGFKIDESNFVFDRFGINIIKFKTNDYELGGQDECGVANMANDIIEYVNKFKK